MVVEKVLQSLISKNIIIILPWTIFCGFCIASAMHPFPSSFPVTKHKSQTPPTASGSLWSAGPAASVAFLPPLQPPPIRYSDLYKSAAHTFPATAIQPSILSLALLPPAAASSPHLSSPTSQPSPSPPSASCRRAWAASQSQCCSRGLGSSLRRRCVRSWTPPGRTVAVAVSPRLPPSRFRGVAVFWACSPIPRPVALPSFLPFAFPPPLLPACPGAQRQSNQSWRRAAGFGLAPDLRPVRRCSVPRRRQITPRLFLFSSFPVSGVVLPLPAAGFFRPFAFLLCIRHQPVVSAQAYSLSLPLGAAGRVLPPSLFLPGIRFSGFAPILPTRLPQVSCLGL